MEKYFVFSKVRIWSNNNKQVFHLGKCPMKMSNNGELRISTHIEFLAFQVLVIQLLNNLEESSQKIVLIPFSNTDDNYILPLTGATPILMHS